MRNILASSNFVTVDSQNVLIKEKYKEPGDLDLHGTQKSI